MRRIDSNAIKESLRRKITAITNVESETKAKLLIEELILATPIDTGKARDSWRIEKQRDGLYKVINDVPYIGRLNDGSSKQAPAHFIESVALKYGKPVGTIVHETP